MSTSFLTAIAASRVTYLVVLVLGMALYARGIGQAAVRNLWTHPVTIAGYLLGALALLLGLQGVFRFRIVPLDGWLLLAGILGIILVKVLLALVYRTA